MGTAREPSSVKLIVSLLAANSDLFAEAAVGLEQRFGSIDFQSELLPFEHTDYYAAEFGSPLARQIVTFQRLVAPTELPGIKRQTNELEWAIAREGRRRVNIDPGYVSLAKLVLATTKDHAHRLYLGQGIYGEVTLAYQGGRFRPWPWTYPDYGDEGMCALILQIRRRYKAQLRREAG
jgi:hypothetical protein